MIESATVDDALYYYKIFGFELTNEKAQALANLANQMVMPNSFFRGHFDSSAKTVLYRMALHACRENL